MRRDYYIYVLTNNCNTTLYIGVTGDLERRIWEHREGVVEGFSKRYRLKKLIHLEEFNDIDEAIAREKQLKNWHRPWKYNLIRETNPNFRDLYQ